MANIKFTVMSSDSKNEAKLIAELRRCFKDRHSVEFVGFHDSQSLGHVLLIDRHIAKLEETIDAFRLDAPSVLFVLAIEQFDDPDLWIEYNKVDCAIVRPFRPTEATGLIHTYKKKQELNEAQANVNKLIHAVEGIHQTEEKVYAMLSSVQPAPHEPVRGLKVSSQYFVGEGKGVDYFEVLDTPSKKEAVVLATRCSSFSASTQWLERLPNFWSVVREFKSGVAFEDLHKEVAKTETLFAEKAQKFSYFCGLFNRSRAEFEAVVFGELDLWIYQPKSATWDKLSRMGGHLRIPIENGTKLLLVSAGLGSVGMDEAELDVWLTSRSEYSSQELGLELRLAVREHLQEIGTEFPPSDVSAVFLEMQPSRLRVA